MRKNYLVLAYLVLTWIGGIYGQSQQFRYQLLEDVSSSRVLAFHEDHQGFMWIGTRGGLIKYNGYEAKTFYYSPTDSNSLASDYTISFYEDKDSILWIGTKGGGIVEFDLTSDKIYNHELNFPGSLEGFVSVIEPLNDSLLLLGTSFGLLQFNMNSHVAELLDGGTWYRAMAPYQDGTFLTGSKLGLQLYDPQTKTLSRFPDTLSGINGPLLAYANDIVVDQEGLIWIASPDFGILTYDCQKKKLTQSCTDRQDPECPVSAMVMDLLADRNGNIWAACSTGVAVFQRDLGKFVRLDGDKRDPKSPLTNRLNALYLDTEENLWLGMGSGVALSHLKSKAFGTLFHDPNDPTGLPKEPIYSMVINAQNDLILGTYGGGVVHMDEKLEVKHIYTYDVEKFSQKGSKHLTSNSIIKVFHSKAGDLWVGAVNGLNRGQLQADGSYYFKSYRNPVARGNFIYAIEEQPNGNLWIGSIAGIFDFDPATGNFSYLLNDSTENSIYSLYHEEDEDVLWIGGFLGLMKYRLSDGKLTQYVHDRKKPNTLSANTVNHVLKDPGGWFWISTEFGLNLFDPKTEKFTVFLEDDGLPDHYIAASFLDSTGNIWLSMGKGTVKLLIERKPSGEPVIQGTRVYTEEHGAAADGHNFGAFVTDEKGTIYLGASGAITYFNPLDITEETEEANVLITSFKVFNEELALSKQPQYLDEIELDYFQNYFSLEFLTLDFSNASKIHYAYMLEGVDPDWIYNDRRFAGYTQLAPGAYDFKVKSTNGEGKWGAPTTLTIRIRPPFWLSWWFGALVLIVLFGIGVSISKFRRRQRLIEREKAIAEQSSRHKAEFLANMSHEIRTPMNAVVGTTHLIQNTFLDPKQKRYVETIRQSAENLLVIINDILDFSKIEAGKLSFIQKPFRIRELTEYVYQTLSHRAVQNETLLTVTCEEEVPEILVGDATRLIQILLNLGSNAVKFTKEGKVDIVVGGKEGLAGKWGLEIKVDDTGIGISEEKLKTIFESFVQGGSEIGQQFGGTGLGLSIARRLVVDQGGEIRVESQEGKGTTFSVEIPYLIGDSTYMKPVEEKLATSTVTDRILKLLLVEDNRINREIAVEIIQEMIPFAKIDTAENGKEVLDLLSELNRYDLILMDIKMPIMDGYTCAKTIREQFPAPINRIPIIALTATATDEEIQNCLEIGMNDFVAKPFDPKMLKDKILKFAQSQENAIIPNNLTQE